MTEEPNKQSREITAGGAIFPRLKALGVDYVFTNSGTDFPPIIEGLAEAAARGEDLPRAIVIPHEHAAMGMAHGYYLMTGRAQAVMLHTNVGLANGAIGAINAACEHIPILLMSGRTPASEQDRFGARTVPIAWGQEMRDQAALVREACKWENDLRAAEQIQLLLDRAWAIANSTPKGPVYLSLPREALTEQVSAETLTAAPAMRPAIGAADPSSVAEAAELLAAANAPLVIAQRGAGDEASFTAFAQWADTWGIAVCSWWATALAIPTDHPCHVGSDPGPWMQQADIVVVLDSLAPWWPDKHKLNPDAKVIQIGPNPIFSRFPTRNFASDVTLAGETALVLPALFKAMSGLSGDTAAIAARREKLRLASAKWQNQVGDAAKASGARGITKAYASLCLSEALENRDSSVFSELGATLGPLRRGTRRSWYQEPHSGGLGWSFPAALGAKLAEPERCCVATMGDGSYIFANPTACHQIAEALGLGVLIMVLNNEEWGAVRASVAQLYPDGFAAKANRMPLTSLKPSPDFIKTAQASRSFALRVEKSGDLPAAIQEALAATDEGR